MDVCDLIVEPGIFGQGKCRGVGSEGGGRSQRNRTYG